MNYKCNDSKKREKSIVLVAVVFLAIPLIACIANASPSTDKERPIQQVLTGRDEKIKWLKSHGVAIRNVDANDTDFSDLKPIAKFIGNARVVQLGESSHGDGTAFKAKVRVIKFLHQHMGFDVMSWESNLYECIMADQALSTDIPIHEAASKGIFNIWSQSQEVQPLFEYIKGTKQTTKPIEMVGFDCQSQGKVLEPIFDFLDITYPGVLTKSDRQEIIEMYKLVFNNEYVQVPEQEKEKYKSILEKYIEKSENPSIYTNERERKLMHRNLINLWDFQHSYSVPVEEIRKGSEQGLWRDKSMGENLHWLAKEYYPDRKIIAWAANFHIAESFATIDGIGRAKGRLAPITPMGAVASELLGDDLYTIGITAYQGECGRVNRNKYSLGPMPSGSFEELCHQTGHKYLFVDFKSLPRDHWMRTDLTAAPIGYGPMTGDWAQVFDAMIFIDEMHPATPIKTKE